MKNNVAIVIPSYKKDISPHEDISLSQLIKVLSKYPIFMIAPDNLSPSYIHNRPIQLLHFENKWFQNIISYSQLMCSNQLYDLFSDFDYILIAQLDTFVFSDQLEYWCNKRYDYIGAPWTFDLFSFSPFLRPYLPFLHRYPKLLFFRTLLGRRFLVGNGGFSLRKVDTFRQILIKFPDKLNEFKNWATQLVENGIFTAYNEDIFWVFFVPRFYRSFKIPTFITAISFAFEVDPALCLKFNKQRLPFGCHDWSKHGLDFWRPIYKKYGYQI